MKWEQNFVIHCPIKDCKGMLLDTPLSHKFKCSDCKKYFVQHTEYIEVKK